MVEATNRTVKKIWVAISTPFQVNFFSPLIKKLGHKFEFLVTARDHDKILSTLKAKRIDFIPVGRHGGPWLRGRLESYADTVKELSPIIEHEKPDLLLTERWPEAVRVAFGFDIPAWTIFYDERERHVNKMVFPLSSLVFAPRFYTPSELRHNGVTDPEKIVWFDGFHACYLKDDDSRNLQARNPFVEMGIKPPIVLVRPEPEFATFFEHRQNVLENIVDKLCQNGGDASVVVIPRTEAQAKRYDRLELTVVTDPISDNPVAYSDVVIGAAETMLMESFVLGKPTISNIYWPESKPVSELHKYIPHITDPGMAVKKVHLFLDPDERAEFSQRSRTVVDQMENPIQKIADEITRRFLQPEYRHSLGRRSKLEIYMDLVLAASSGPSRLTYLMQAANLSYGEVKKSISYLNRKGMLWEKSDGAGGAFYRATPEGLELLKTYRKVRETLSDRV